MNYTEYLDELADRFLSVIKHAPNCKPIPTEDFGWTNYRFQSDVYRMAHVERYSDRVIEVLHITTLPHRWSPEPIFGFDVITTEKGVTGVYMDLSPVIKNYDFDTDADFNGRKPLPQWATVFSDKFIMIKPESISEFMRFCSWSLEKYKTFLKDGLYLKEEVSNIDEVINTQNRYCEVQASNPRTFGALKAKIGEERARYFMEQILFPKIEKNDDTTESNDTHS
jgi:hypothetical protein